MRTAIRLTPSAERTSLLRYITSDISLGDP